MDFDADGSLGLDDFFLFADHYGATQEDTVWDPIYDLDRNGLVDMDDFYIFLDWWPDPASPYQEGRCGDGSIIHI